MRLSANEVAAIKDAAREAFGESAVVRLFGSRLEPQKIDLIVTKRGGTTPRGFERIAYRDGHVL